MLDKIKRQVNYIEKGTLSVDSAEDDIIDLINYSVLLHALNIENEEKSTYINNITTSDVESWTEPDIIEEEPDGSGYTNPEQGAKENGIDFAYDEHNYKKGDKVEIVNTDGHFFKYDDIVTLKKLTDEGWYADDSTGFSQIVLPSQIKPIEQKETSRSFGI